MQKPAADQRRWRGWSDRDIEANLRAVLGDRDRWPGRGEFEAAGESRLLRALYANGGARAWAQRMGVAYPPLRRRTDTDTWTRPDLSHRKTKLGEVRHACGRSQPEVARRASISRRTMQRLEAGEIDNPSLRQLANIALVLGVPVAALIEEAWLEAVPVGSIDTVAPTAGPAGRLAAARDAAGLSPQELAVRAGRGVSTIKRLEAGQNPHPSLRLLVAVARALGTPLSSVIEPEWLDGAPLRGRKHGPRGRARLS